MRRNTFPFFTKLRNSAKNANEKDFLLLNFRLSRSRIHLRFCT